MQLSCHHFVGIVLIPHETTFWILCTGDFVGTVHPHSLWSPDTQQLGD